MKVEIVNVTPVLAAEWLATSVGNPRWANSKNRKVTDDRFVIRMAEDMRSGHWYGGNNTIAFDENGHLVDGHHRLSAVIKSGMTIQFVVVWGVSQDGERHIDDNRVRTEKQRTGASTSALGTAGIHLAMIEGFVRGSTKLSTEQKLRWIDLHPMIHEISRLVSKTAKPQLLNNAKAAHAFLCAYEYGISTTQLERFATVVSNGFVEDDGETAAVVVRNFLLSNRGGNYNTVERVPPLFVDCVIQAGLYDFVNDIPRTKKYKPKRGRFFDMNIAMGNKLYTSMWGDE